MPRLRAFADAICIASLSLWLGVVVMSGLVAAVAFPAMKALNPTIPEYAAYPFEHWKIAAGLLARTVFDLSAVMQWGLATITFIALAFRVVSDPPPRKLPLARIILACASAAALATWRLGIAPGMDANLDGFLGAARAGEKLVADTHRNGFNAAHPLVSRVMMLLAVALLAAIVATAWGMIPRLRNAPGRPA